MTNIKVILSQQHEVLTDTTRCKSLVRNATGDLGELTCPLTTRDTCQTLHQVMMGSSHNPPLTVPDRDFLSLFLHPHLVEENFDFVLFYLSLHSLCPSFAGLVRIAVQAGGAAAILN